VDRGVLAVIDPEQQDLPGERVHAADRALRSVREVEGMGRRDRGGGRPASGEGMRVVAAQHSRQAPEAVGHHAERAAGVRAGSNG
jgi:hypothetical protein